MFQALLLQNSAMEQKKSRGKHSPEERGTEILERMEDLQNEGVQAAQQRTGAKLNKVSKITNCSILSLVVNLSNIFSFS